MLHTHVDVRGSLRLTGIQETGRFQGNQRRNCLKEQTFLDVFLKRPGDNFSASEIETKVVRIAVVKDEAS